MKLSVFSFQRSARSKTGNPFLKAESRQLKAGFTLIEMLVSLALFAIVVLVAIGALLSLVGANKKAQALEAVMDNLNITVDDMVRNAREGTEFHCGASGSIATPQDCSSGGTYFAFQPYGVVTPGDQWVFAYDTNDTYCGVDVICKSTQGGLPGSWSA